MQVDPRRNVPMFEYYYALLKSGYYSKFLGFALRLPDSIKNVAEVADNWYKVILGYPLLVLKRSPLMMRFRDGIIRIVSRREDVAKA